MNEKRILVIEDEFLVALEIQSQMREAGFGPVEHAATEKEALKRIQEGSWDAVVADANLNGRGLQRVTAALNQHRIPFIIVTGYSRDSLPPEVAQVPVLHKPIDGQRLIQEVRRLLFGQTSGGSIA